MIHVIAGRRASRQRQASVWLSTESKVGIVAGVDLAKGTVVGREVREEIRLW